MRQLLVGCIWVLVSCGQQAEKVKPRVSVEQEIDQIKTIMQQQEDAWNTGSLEAFMKGYWESDSLLFIGKSGINYGWQKTVDNYKKTYSTPEQMGRLEFENKLFQPLGSKHMLVIGKWTLFRELNTEKGQERDTLTGHYSLNWEKKNGTWLIVADHSS